MKYKLKKIMTNKKFEIFAISISVMFIIFNVLRAKNTGITYDEAYTYRNYVFSNPFTVFSYIFKPGTLANNHLLNSFFISFFQRLIPIYYNELLIRVPNLLFYIIYLIFAYKLSCMYKHKYSCFGLFVFNYGVHEYFGLARGYGIACSLVLVAVYFLKLWINEKEKFKYLNFSYISLVLACYANTVSLIAFASVLVLSFIILLKNKLILKYMQKSIPYFCIILPSTLLIIKYHFMISSDGLSLYGGTGNFYTNVIVSFFNTYGLNDISNYVSYVFIFLMIIICIKCRKSLLNNPLIFLELIYFGILICMTIITKQMWITGRSLIPFVPIVLLSVMELLDVLKKNLLHILIFISCLIVFVYNFDLNKTREWENDYPVKNVAYSAYRNKNSNLLKPYLNNESTNFYRDKILKYHNYDIYENLER